MPLSFTPLADKNPSFATQRPRSPQRPGTGRHRDRDKTARPRGRKADDTMSLPHEGLRLKDAATRQPLLVPINQRQLDRIDQVMDGAASDALAQRSTRPAASTRNSPASSMTSSPALSQGSLSPSSPPCRSRPLQRDMAIPVEGHATTQHGSQERGRTQAPGRRKSRPERAPLTLQQPSAQSSLTPRPPREQSPCPIDFRRWGVADDSGERRSITPEHTREIVAALGQVNHQTSSL